MKKKDMFVIALRYPKDVELPDILEEDGGKIMYFKNKEEAQEFLQSLYSERGLLIQAFVDDNVELMRVQWNLA